MSCRAAKRATFRFASGSAGRLSVGLAPGFRVGALLRIAFRVALCTAALGAGPRIALAQEALAREALAQEAFADPWGREVAVADRGPEERQEAQSLALREVLLANSGDKTLLNRDDVRAGLRDAERYVERYEYRTPSPGTVIASGTPLTDTVRESGEATQLMRVTFDRGLLGALIAGDDEPDVQGEEADDDIDADPFTTVEAALMWLLIEDGRRDILLSDPAARNVRARAREIAGARGLALRYPTGDEEDAALVDADVLRRDDMDAVRVASGRYPEPVVLVGRLARDGLDAWEGRWTKVAGESIERATFTTGSLDEALQEGLDWLSSAAAGGDDRYRYGGDAASDAEALVWVGALDSINAYATVMDFLTGVPGVGTVYPKEIDERGMTFTVVPRGALPAIASAADALPWLRRATPPIYERELSAFASARVGGDRRPAGEDATGGTGSGTTNVDVYGGVSGSRTGTGDARDSRAPETGSPDGRLSERGASDGRNPGRGFAGDRSANAPANAPKIPAPLARDAELAFDYLR